MEELKIYSVNARGLADIKKRRKVFNYLRNLNFDLVCIQESHSNALEEELWKKQWNGVVFFTHGATNSRGVCVLVKPKFNGKVLLTYRDDQDTDLAESDKGRLLVLSVEYEDIQIALGVIYAPNEDSPMFFEHMDNKINIADCNEHVIVGDFNCVLDVTLDRKGSTHNQKRCAEVLLSLMEK